MPPFSLSIDPELARKADALFRELGLDITSAVSLFLLQSLREQGLPFTPRLLAAPAAPRENGNEPAGNIDADSDDTLKKEAVQDMPPAGDAESLRGQMPERMEKKRKRHAPSGKRDVFCSEPDGRRPVFCQ